jgi:hypothetical protein
MDRPPKDSNWVRDTRRSRCCQPVAKSAWNKTGLCPFPIWKDEFCRKHHPVVKVAIADRRVKSLEAKLEAARAELVQMNSWLKKVTYE